MWKRPSVPELCPFDYAIFRVVPRVEREEFINVGVILLRAGEAEKARKCLETALSIRTETYGAHHPKVARAVGQLGLVLFHVGRFELAREKILEAMSTRSKIEGSDYDLLNYHLNLLGRISLEMNEYDRARSEFGRAWPLSQQEDGDGNSQTAIARSGLGRVQDRKIGKRA